MNNKGMGIFLKWRDLQFLLTGITGGAYLATIHDPAKFIFVMLGTWVLSAVLRVAWFIRNGE